MEMRAKKSSRSSTSNTSGSTTTTAVERKEIERRRRQQMKSLCAKLASLIPKEHYSSKDAMTQLGSLDEAATYIKRLKERVEELRQKSASARLLAAGSGTRRGGGGGGASTSSAAMTTASGGAGSSEEAGRREDDMPPAVVEVRQHNDGSSLDVVLISSAARPFKLHEVVTVLEEEGAETVNANFSVAGTKIFYTIHCKAFCPRIGIDVSRVSERLRALG